MRNAPDKVPGAAAHVFAVFLCGMFAFLDLYCVQPLLPLLSHVFRASEGRVGITISASTVGVAISAVLLAIFGERLPRKPTIVASMAALAVAALLTSTATSLVSLACWRFVQGLVTPGIFIITIAYITEEWPALMVPRVMSVYVAGTVFGGFVGRLLGGLIAEHLGWRDVFFVLGCIGVFGALATQRMLPAARRRASVAPPTGRLDALFASLRNPRLVATFAIGFCMLFTLISIFSFITFYVSAAPFHLSTTAISYLFGVYLVGLAATLAAGTVLARIGLRHGMLAAVGLCLGGLGFTLVHSLPFVALGLAFASSGVFIAQTCANSFLRDAAPAGSRVSAAGLYICSYYIGGSVGGVLPGLAWSAGGWPACAALTAAFLVIAGATAFFGWPPHNTAPDPIPL
ncbi:MAG: MFS transporter [Acidobacteria bacterium]|nr:MFS transporter [Acidobacteriota bacterium]